MFGNSLTITRRVRSVDVKSTEVNTEKSLKTRHFRAIGILFWWLPNGRFISWIMSELIGWVDRLKMGKVEWIRWFCNRSSG